MKTEASSETTNERTSLLNFFVNRRGGSTHSITTTTESNNNYDNEDEEQDCANGKTSAFSGYQMERTANRTSSDFSKEDEDDDPSLSKKHNHRKFIIIPSGLRIAAFTLLAGGIMTLVILIVQRNTTNNSSGGGGPHTNGGGGGTSIETNRGLLSALDPVKDLGMPPFDRPHSSRPSSNLNNIRSEGALPTNAWYQNLILVEDEPSSNQIAYTIPYSLDMVGPIPGLRVHHTHISSSNTVVQVDFIDTHGVTLGAGADAIDTLNGFSTRQYSIHKMTPLAITLDWEYFPMKSTLAKGMAYATMVYNEVQGKNLDGETVYPTIASELPPSRPLLIDGKNKVTCSSIGQKPVLVHKEIEMYFDGSDFSWLAFFSEPALIQCIVDSENVMKIQVVGGPSSDFGTFRNFVVRLAILNPCSTGRNPVFCQHEVTRPNASLIGDEDYGSVLRNHSQCYPGPEANIDYQLVSEKLVTVFDWDAQCISFHNDTDGKESDLIAFALPHHLDLLVEEDPTFCTGSLLGPACIVSGSNWTMTDDAAPVSFRAPRPPEPWAIPDLMDALSKDLSYRLPHYFQKGVGDTYFSGKMIAKSARVLLIYEELKELCTSSNRTINEKYHSVCTHSDFTDTTPFSDALDALRRAVTIWLNGKAEALFVYDDSWGGIASCGCLFDDKTYRCKNHYPSCPGFEDPGLNFGSAFYNDQHFHFGYHIYGAAALAHFDAAWGREYFQRVLLLIRSIANGSNGDKYFPLWRHKDWYQGHSWASGIATAYHNGRNQESSSEAIAAYEAVAMYGEAMIGAFQHVGSEDDRMTAVKIKEVGIALTTTEVRSTRKYYHVHHGGGFPPSYTPHVIGILWTSMLQFQTFFGGQPFFANGIQLIPTTPITESRDGVAWAKKLYPDFSAQCASSDLCKKSGWSILPLSLLAIVGHPKEAVKGLLQIHDSAFLDPGGNGQSLSNSIWFAATRPELNDPLPLKETNGTQGLDYCHKPQSCTDAVLDRDAGEYTCRQRIEYLISTERFTPEDACIQVARFEFPSQCANCDPGVNMTRSSPVNNSSCPQCEEQVCRSPELNRCPTFHHTYVCTSGINHGGCSDMPWTLGPLCDDCCELTNCARFPAPLSDVAVEHTTVESTKTVNCPPCPSIIINSHLNLCPSQVAPFLCTKGKNVGGCSFEPWTLSTGQCLECCTLPKK